MTGGRHRAAEDPAAVDDAHPVPPPPVAPVPRTGSCSSEPVRPSGPAIYDPSVLPRPAAGPRHGAGRRVAGLRAPAALRAVRLTLTEPRHRALAVGVTVVVAVVGGTGLVLTSAAAPAPHRAALAPVRAAAPAPLTPTTAPVISSSSAAGTSSTAVVPVPVAGPVVPTRAASTAPVQAAAISALTSDGIPSTALAAYRDAAARELRRAPACGITWPLLAGIGRVESDHGRTGGSVLHTDGSATPRILGARLDGHGTAVIRDTDHGRLDGDPVYDRAVGPMQFIPSTWAGWGVDANHDGVRDPNNIYDAAAAAADYLCAAGRDLRTYTGVVRAIRSYNNSQAYVALVLDTARAYARGTPVVVPTPPPGAPPATGEPTLPPADPGPPKGLQHTPKPKPAPGSSTSPSRTAGSPSPTPGRSSSSHPGGPSSSGSSSGVPSGVTLGPSGPGTSVTNGATHMPTNASTTP